MIRFSMSKSCKIIKNLEIFKIQTDLVMKKNHFHRFLALFRLRIIQIENKYFEKFTSFEKFDPFWPKFGAQFGQKDQKYIFLIFFAP